MNKNRVRRSVMALGMLVIFSGCATARNDPFESTTVTIRQAVSQDIYLSGVSVVEKEDHVEVSGWVRRHYVWSIADGHVDLAIMNPDGETVQALSVGYTPGVIPRRGVRRSHFRVDLPLHALGRGSSVRVGFHRDGIRSGHGVFDCGGNVAAPRAEGA